MLRQLLAKDAAVCLQSFLAFSLCLLLVELQWRQVVGQAAAGNHYNKGCASGVRSTFTIIVIGEVGASHLVTSPHLTGLTTFTQQGESASEAAYVAWFSLRNYIYNMNFLILSHANRACGACVPEPVNI